MFKAVWFSPALLNQVDGSLEETPGSFREVNDVSSPLRQRFHEQGRTFEADGFAHGSRFLSS
jgi:hypothetical protein